MIGRSRLEDRLYSFMYKSMMYDKPTKQIATGVRFKFVLLLPLCITTYVLLHVL